MYTSYKGDETFKEIIVSIYDFIQSTPHPKEWLEEKVKLFDCKETSFEQTIWGKVLFKQAKNMLEDMKLRVKQELNRIKYEDDIEKFVQVLTDDTQKIDEVYNSSDWNSMFEKLEVFQLSKFPINKKVAEELKDRMKAVRQTVREDIKKIKGKILIYSSKQAFEDIKIMYEILTLIKEMVIEFSDRFKASKQAKNIMDFSDIEHFALDILNAGEAEKNHVCKKYIDKFEEILIDEYQDSNLVQEKILSSISRGNNTFMVGDVKQSIYKFRQARPELFLDKYEKYKVKEELQTGDDLKIQLFKNFRSRQNVLTLTNLIFDSIMSRELGDIDYTNEEYLNLRSLLFRR